MISKYEYLYAKKKKDELTFKLAEYEAKSIVYAMWQKWQAMSPAEKQDLINKWEAYYTACNNSYYGKKYREARSYFSGWVNTGDGEAKSKLLAIVNEVKHSNVSFLKTPSTIDPRELERKMTKYYDVKKRQQEYKDIFDEYEEIFEPKKTKGNESL